MTQGGSGFTQGDDFVAARVSIDVPSEGIQSLRELSQGIDRFRTSVEQSARSAGTYLQYVQQITQAANMAAEAHRNLAAGIERTGGMQQQAGGAPGGAANALPLSRSAPQGYVDPWAGMGVGMGGQRSATTPQNVHPGNSDAYQQGTIDPTRQLDPRKYINAQAGRYRVLPSDFTSPSEMAPVDLDSVAGRVEQRDRVQRQQEQSSGNTMLRSAGESLFGGMGGGLARNVFNEMLPGKGSALGMGNLAMRGLQMAGRMSGAAGPGASGVATAAEANATDAITAEGMLGGLGRMAGPVGIGLAGVGALEKGGAMYQGYKNLGSIRGGGAAEGFGSEMQMRGLALNPFLSNEQSRQIIMAGLTEGYSGKTFDTVTQFMASNLKDMNMQVSESVGLLRKNVVEGGQSVAGLATSLGVIKEMSKSGVMSMPDILSSVEATSASGVNAGMSGGQATELGMINSQVWNDPSTRALKGTFAPLADSILNNPAGGAALRVWGGANVPGGIPPDQMRAYLSAHGGAKAVAGATSQMIGNLVKQAFRSPASRDKNSPAYFQAMSLFMRLLKQYAPGSPQSQDENLAMQTVDQYLSGADPVADAQKRVSDATSSVQGSPSLLDNIGDLGNMAVSGAGVGLDMANPITIGTSLFSGKLGNDWQDFNKDAQTEHYNFGAEAQNPVLGKVAGMYGPNNIELVGKDGNAQSLNGSRGQVEAFSKGDLNWRRKGESGGGMSATQTLPSGGRVDDGRGGAPSQTSVNFSPASVQISIDNNGKATASPNPVQLTPNQQGAMSGADGATMNNPPPGDGYGYYRGRWANGGS